jgi:hypothetical protein
MRSIIANLAPASERQDHTTSPSASGHVRLTCHPRPPHPRPTYRDDRPKRPSSSRRDAREHRRDLPDGASANMCDRLARRASACTAAARPSQQRAHASTAGSGQAFFTANDHTFPARLTSAAPTTLKMSVDRGRPETRSGRPSAKVTRSAPTSGPDPTGRRTRTLRTSRPIAVNLPVLPHRLVAQIDAPNEPDSSPSENTLGWLYTPKSSRQPD